MKAVRRKCFQMKNITEAQQMLLMRAAKITQLRKKETPTVPFFKILENAFAENHIRYQYCAPNPYHQSKAYRTYLCFGNLYVCVVDQTHVNKEETTAAEYTPTATETKRQVTIIFTKQKLLVKTHLTQKENIGTDEKS